MGCSAQPARNAAPRELLLVSYAVSKGAYDRILPRFEADWKASTGQAIAVKASYGGVGSQTRAIIDGLDADVATLALSGDVLKLQEEGLVQPAGRRTCPAARSSPTRWWPSSPATANPKTSGGARWNVLGL